MSYNRHRHEQLRRLGVEQLPAIHTTPDWPEHRHAPHHPFNGDLPVRTMPVSHAEVFNPIDTVLTPLRFQAAGAQTACPRARPYGSSPASAVRNVRLL